MASKSSLIITTEDHLTGTTQQSTITDINPAASNSDLKTFAQMTAALSKDEYVKSARVDRLELDNDTRTAYPNPQIKGVSSASSNISYINITDNNKANLLITQACVGTQVSVQAIEFLWSIATSNADAFNRAPYFKNITSTDGVDRALVQRNQSFTRWQLFLGGGTEKPAVGTVIKATLCIDGNAFYKDAEWDLTITVVETEG